MGLLTVGTRYTHGLLLELPSHGLYGLYFLLFFVLYLCLASRWGQDF